MVHIKIRYFSVAHLRPGPNPPVSRAGYSVAGTSGLRFLSTAVFAVDGAICALVQELNASHGSDLVAKASTGFRAVLPFLSYPPFEKQTG